MSVASLPHLVSTGSRQGLRAAFGACRTAILGRIADLDDEGLRAQPDSGFSPIGWHLGHIAYTEALWLSPGDDPHPEWALLFRQDGLPKSARRDLPRRDELEAYLAAVRDAVFERLAADDGAVPERLWRFVLQHEAQHGETIAVLRRLAGIDKTPRLSRIAGTDDDATVEVPMGPALLGDDGPDALDNERQRHRVSLRAFQLSRTPVSQGRYRRFIDAGGYGDRAWWSERGWAWRSQSDIAAPLYWVEGADTLPVHGVSAYEAEAYCRFIGARLPSEAEWERAAAAAPHLPLMGQVWQWTSTDFAPYPGFEPYPYRGYSAAYFDGRHRVLKGGSWATLTPCLRPGFRNWYEPETRQIFAGFRYARDI